MGAALERLGRWRGKAGSWAFALRFMGMAVGCERPEGGHGAGTLDAATTSTLTSTTALTPPAAASRASTAGAASGAREPGGVTAPAGPGTWEGRYEAKRAHLSVPPGVKDPSAEDKGKAALGGGTLQLRVSPTGELEGVVKGALGPSKLQGKMEGEVLRATLTAVDPLAPGALNGVFVGKLKGDVVLGELHVAGGDARVVREAAVELRRAK